MLRSKSSSKRSLARFPRTSPNRRKRRLAFEPLEDRTLLATLLNADLVGGGPTVTLPPNFGNESGVELLFDGMTANPDDGRYLTFRVSGGGLSSTNFISIVADLTTPFTINSVKIANDWGSSAMSSEVTDMEIIFSNSGGPIADFTVFIPPDGMFDIDDVLIGINVGPVTSIEFRITGATLGFDAVEIRELVVEGVPANVTATISGTVFVDADADGLFDGGTETAIDGVEVKLFELVESVFEELATDTTAMGGVYAFTVDDEFGTYSIRETQPTGVDDGAAIVGDADNNGTTGEAIDGTVITSNEMQLTLTGIDALDYDFTEVGQAVQAGDTATIGFWQNKNGRALIEQGGAALVPWLNANFGNIFGDTFSDGSGGDDAAEVASFYKNEFFKKKLKGTSKVDAQFMSLALATFFTSSNLSGGSVAAGFGFNVTETGIGTNVVNVGSSGDAFGVDDNTNMTIMAILLASNGLTGADNDGDASEDYSHVYDANGDGVLDNAEKALRALANDLYTLINEGGDI